MKIKLNEKFLEISKNKKILDLKNEYKSNADVIIYNGAVVSENIELFDGDAVVFIKKGEIPSFEELEALMVSRHTPGVHKKLKNSTVGIAGLGGLGSTIAISLARIGVGKLIISDFDVVEPSNLNRQQYFYDQIGKFKTDATLENLKRINPYVEIEKHNIYLNETNIKQIYSSVDVMIEAFDNPKCKSMIANEFGNLKEIPLIMASGMAGYSDISLIKAKKISSNIYVVGDLINAAKPGSGLMSPRVGVVANYQANIALQIIMGEKISS